MKYIALAIALGFSSMAYASGVEDIQYENDCTGTNFPIFTLNSDGSKTWVLPNTNIKWCNMPGLSPQEDPVFRPDGGGEGGSD